MSALSKSEIKNFWVATGLPTMIVLFKQLSNTIGQYPLLDKQFPDDGLDAIEDLLTGAEIKFRLMEDVTYSRCAHFYSLYLFSRWNGLARL